MRSTQLYLDTARLGRMSRRAQQAQWDLTRLAGDEGASDFFDRFLYEGSQHWSTAIRTRYPGLACWQGVAKFKEDLRTLAGSDPELPLLIVNRSAQLMKFAARLLFHPCRNVLVTDLGWPPYHDILVREAQRADRTVTTAAVRSLTSDGCATEDDVIRQVCRQFRESRCDGLFLTAVSHLGIRLPVERLVRTLEAAGELRFVVVDGAQDFCHVSADLGHEYCDLYLASCHKWLQGFHPLGLGFYGRRSSRPVVERVLQHLLTNGDLDDPLLRFTTQMERGSMDGETETVNLLPLFSGQGAACDALEMMNDANSRQLRQQNLATAASLASESGWRSLIPAAPFQTGILLLQAERTVPREQSPRELRNQFGEHGVALTAYDAGVIRLSMPSTPWQPAELDRLRTALRATA